MAKSAAQKKQREKQVNKFEDIYNQLTISKVMQPATLFGEARSCLNSVTVTAEQSLFLYAMGLVTIFAGVQRDRSDRWSLC